MLILRRGISGRIIIGEGESQIEVKVLRAFIDRDNTIKVDIGIDAPKSLAVDRAERRQQRKGAAVG